MSLQIHPKNGGKSDRIANAKEQKVTVYHVTAHDKVEDGKGYQYRTTLDFSKCTTEEILLKAADSVIIEARNHYNFKHCQKPEELADLVIDVAEMIRSKRKTVDKVAKVSKMVDAMTEEEKQKLREALGL